MVEKLNVGDVVELRERYRKNGIHGCAVYYPIPFKAGQRGVVTDVQYICGEVAVKVAIGDYVLDTVQKALDLVCW